jgi:hypothetical protein
MSHDRLPDLPPELKTLAADLAALVPASGALSRDELMYRAGWEACAATEAVDFARPEVHAHAKSVQCRRSSWLWPLSTAGLLLVSVTLAIALATRTTEVGVVDIARPVKSTFEVEQVQHPFPIKATAFPPSIAQDAGAPPKPPLNSAQVHLGHEYFALRGQVLAFGVDALDSRAAAATPGEQAAVEDSRYGALLHELRGG